MKMSAFTYKNVYACKYKRAGHWTKTVFAAIAVKGVDINKNCSNPMVAISVLISLIQHHFCNTPYFAYWLSMNRAAIETTSHCYASIRHTTAWLRVIISFYLNLIKVE